MKQFSFSIVATFLIIAASCNNPVSTTHDGKDSSATDTSSTSPKDRIAVVKAYYETLFHKHDTAALADVYANGYTEYNTGESPAKTYATPDSLIIGVKRLLHLTPDITTSNESYFAGDSGKVVVIATFTGKWTGDIPGEQKATGKAYKFNDADIYTVNADGKLTSHKSIYPDIAFFDQIGYQPKKK